MLDNWTDGDLPLPISERDSDVLAWLRRRRSRGRGAAATDNVREERGRSEFHQGGYRRWGGELEEGMKELSTELSLSGSWATETTDGEGRRPGLN